MIDKNNFDSLWARYYKKYTFYIILLWDTRFQNWCSQLISAFERPNLNLFSIKFTLLYQGRILLVPSVDNSWILKPADLTGEVFHSQKNEPIDFGRFRRLQLKNKALKPSCHKKKHIRTRILSKSAKPSSYNPIWTRGEQNGPLRVFAKYLKNNLANLYETLWLLRPIYRSSFKIKSLRIGHLLLSW